MSPSPRPASDKAWRMLSYLIRQLQRIGVPVLVRSGADKRTLRTSCTPATSQTIFQNGDSEIQGASIFSYAPKQASSNSI